MKEYCVWLAKLITLLILIFIVVPAMIGGVLMASKGMVGSEGPPPSDKNTVAVIELTGIIESTKDVLEELHRQVDNPRVEGIVLRIDSPGGAVAPSQDVYSAVMKLKEQKPIVASMGSLAASGGFYSAIGASKIIAEPGTMTGSVGVILQIPNFSKIMQTVGVDVVTIKSGKLKDVGNTFRPMTEDERAYLEKTALTVHNQFIEDVARARNLPVDQVREYADGRVILGSEAKKLNLIDGFGDVYEAARVIFEIKNKPLAAGVTPNLYYPGEKFREFKKILDVATLLPKIFSNHAQLRFEMPY